MMGHKFSLHAGFGYPCHSSDAASRSRGRADTEALGLIVSIVAGLIGGWLIGGSLKHAVVWAVILPAVLIIFVVSVSYAVNRRR